MKKTTLNLVSNITTINTGNLLKRGFIWLCFLIPFNTVIAQVTPSPSADKNYVITYTPRNGGMVTSTDLNSALTDKTKVQTDIQYFDGLGRPMQTVGVKASPTGNDIVQPIAYDLLGREVLKYLPYAVPATATSDGTYKSTAIADQAAFYNPAGSSGTQLPGGVPRITTPYSGTNYEASPLNRVVEQGAPGDPWQLSTSGVSGSGHTVSVAYGLNAANDVINWTVNSGGGATGNTFYPANTLYSLTTTDEQGNNTIQYKDIQGRVICKRVQRDAGAYISTYYLFDDFNNLCYVIPAIPAGTTYPASFAETDQVFLNFIYGYHYDARHRQIEKKLPGKGWEYMAYNNIDKLVATQDANQRGQNPQQWTFIKYDQLGREVLTGGCYYPTANGTPNTNYRAALQTVVNGVNTLWETAITTGNGYTANAWPGSWFGTLSINYYDNYANIPGFISSYTPPDGYNQSTRGLLLESTTYVFKTAVMLATLNYYDGLGRVSKTYKQHYFGGMYSVNNYDIITPTYNFTNAVTASARQNYVNNQYNNTPILKATIVNGYVYDHEGRKTQTFEQINSGTNVMLSQMGYNEVGQAYQKKLHSEDNGSNFIETVAYSVNERGWLTETNSANFDEKLYYNNPSGNIAGLTGLYNGNILEANYNSPNVVNKAFAYTYDSMNRLTGSKYYASGTYNGALDEAATYDYLGNITQMVRGSYGSQPFVYSGTFAYTSYAGNQVNTITNNGAAYKTYTYDQNGNVLTGGTFSYDYNLLNLPNDVKLNGTIFNTYVYDANGQKLRKVSTASGYTTDYISGIQYKNGVLDFIETEEGRYEFSGSPIYQYYLKDHLGNIRVIIQKNTATTAAPQQESEYYAFGLNAIKYDNNTKNKYLYNGKELQDEDNLNLYDYGARLYDPVIARWTSVDPLAEINRRYSPYNYVEDNPIDHTDPDGMLCDCNHFGGEIGEEKPEEHYTNNYRAPYIGSNAGSSSPNDWVRIANGQTTYDPNVHNNADAVRLHGKGSLDISGMTLNTTNGKTVHFNGGNADTWYYVGTGKMNDGTAPQTGDRFNNIEFSAAIGTEGLNQFADVGENATWLIGGGIAGIETGLIPRASELWTNIVYQGFDSEGVVKYVGITSRDLLERAAEHWAVAEKTGGEFLDYRVIQGAENLPRIGARVWEQSLINELGLGGKVGQTGQLLNKINSIAPKYWGRFGL